MNNNNNNELRQLWFYYYYCYTYIDREKWLENERGSALVQYSYVWYKLVIELHV